MNIKLKNYTRIKLGIKEDLTRFSPSFTNIVAFCKRLCEMFNDHGALLLNIDMIHIKTPKSSQNPQFLVSVLSGRVCSVTLKKSTIIKYSSHCHQKSFSVSTKTPKVHLHGARKSGSSFLEGHFYISFL